MSMLHRLVRRSRKLRRPAKSPTRRFLYAERLEDRALLSADGLLHNVWNPTDVDGDGITTPRDALMVINALNRTSQDENTAQAEGEDGPRAMLDVTGDGHLTPLDALLVINRLNGEGEDLEPVVQFRLEPATLDGSPITTASVGQEFLLNVYVQDIRPDDPVQDRGVFAAYLDVFYDADLATVSSGITHVAPYTNARAGDTSTPGVIEQAGAIDGLEPLGTGEFLVWHVSFTADAEGQLNFVGDSSDQPGRDVLLFGVDQPVLGERVEWGTFTLDIVSNILARDDEFTVLEDSTNNELDVLANDELIVGTELFVGSFTQPANGTVSMGPDQQSLLYTPDPFFHGVDTFTYEAENELGDTSQATVTVIVDRINRPPVHTLPGTQTIDPEVGETEVVFSEATGNPIRVDDPDDDELEVQLSVDTGTLALATTDGLTFTAGSDQSSSMTFTGTLADINAALDGLTYTAPAEFLGVVTLNIISDDRDAEGVGGPGITSDDVTILVGVLPVARDIDFTVAEDSVDNILDVMANDQVNPGAQPILVGVATTTAQSPADTASTQEGGVVTVTADGRVSYTPLENFFGTDRFVYSMRDTSPDSITTTAVVTITVTEVNDPPITQDVEVSVPEGTRQPDDSVAPTVDFPISFEVLLEGDVPGPPNESDQTLEVVGVVDTTTQQGGTVQFDPANNRVLYTPPANFVGLDQFQYIVRDDGTTAGQPDPQEAVGNVLVTVTEVNHPPVARDVNLIAFENFTRTFSVDALLANDDPGPPHEADQTLTVIDVSSPTALGGTVQLSADGQSVIYTPPADTVDVVDTFTYTIQDDGTTAGQPDPLTASATVFVEILAFQPSTISGFVYVDVNDDGQVGERERRLTGVTVELVGTDFTGSDVTQTAVTDSTGAYAFEELAPGTYTISSETPAFFRDGQDTPGTLGDRGDENNQFTIEIEEPGGFDASGYNFGQRGLQGQYVTILEMLASTPGEGGFAAVDQDGTALWLSWLDGFEEFRFGELVTNSDASQALLTVVDQDNRVWTTLLNEGDFYYRLSGEDGNRLIRFDGTAADRAFSEIELASRPSQPDFAGYLESVDAFFAQFE